MQLIGNVRQYVHEGGKDFYSSEELYGSSRPFRMQMNASSDPLGVIADEASLSLKLIRPA